MGFPKEGEKYKYIVINIMAPFIECEETTILKGTQSLVIGANDRTVVTESDGRTWITREPAICYFHANYWFNVIGMLRKRAYIIIVI